MPKEVLLLLLLFFLLLLQMLLAVAAAAAMLLLLAFGNVFKFNLILLICSYKSSYSHL